MTRLSQACERGLDRKGIIGRSPHQLEGDEVSELIRDLLKDLRSDVKKLIDALFLLSNSITKLESLASSLDRLTRQLEEVDRNFRVIAEVLKELSK